MAIIFVALGLVCIPYFYLWKTEHFTPTPTVVPGDDLSPSNYSPSDYSPFYGGASTRPIDISSDPLPNATLSERLDAWERAPMSMAEGLGDIDCDMLADADEEGHARAPAQEMIMRRAVREQGVNSFWHGGDGSPFCLGLEYTDIRPQWRRDQDEADRRVGDVGSDPDAKRKGVWPDWSDPFEIVHWADDPHLNNFENTLYTRFQFDVRYEP
ncbi:hypothetical protein CspHIS471_0705430 [Cutaneotrichosporon sp. HIS471]|nr:hypothetical protein CspHIS471_0705430 [Cutaneotrichosporon sp. HIS471]